MIEDICSSIVFSVIDSGGKQLGQFHLMDCSYFSSFDLSEAVGNSTSSFLAGRCWYFFLTEDTTEKQKWKHKSTKEGK